MFLYSVLRVSIFTTFDRVNDHCNVVPFPHFHVCVFYQSLRPVVVDTRLSYKLFLRVPANQAAWHIRKPGQGDGICPHNPTPNPSTNLEFEDCRPPWCFSARAVSAWSRVSAHFCMPKVFHLESRTRLICPSLSCNPRWNPPADLRIKSESRCSSFCLTCLK